MPDVPNNAVDLGVEDFRQRHRKLDRAQGRREVAALLQDDLQDAFADLRGGFHGRVRTRRGVAFCPKASSQKAGA